MIYVIIHTTSVVHGRCTFKQSNGVGVREKTESNGEEKLIYKSEPYSENFYVNKNCC